MDASVIVCLQGLGRSSSDWGGVRLDLQRLGRVVTPELPQSAERAYRTAADVTPDGAILIGHSFGAIMAMRLAAEPGRSIRGVVMSSSFFPPARNGRSLARAVADYVWHRVAFVRELGGPAACRAPGREGSEDSDSWSEPQRADLSSERRRRRSLHRCRGARRGRPLRAAWFRLGGRVPSTRLGDGRPGWWRSLPARSTPCAMDGRA